MSPLRLAAAIGLLTLVAGCATITPEQQRAMDEEECRSYGFRPGTTGFAECLQRIELDRRAERRARMIAMDHWLEPRVVYRPIIVRAEDD
ncbi:hypothetical protein NYR54_04420 [Chelativorans sp. SCAU2101]|jgi:hypothetical protein|uniref:Lipoprotein n=1 Tax=Chelativorans petroleitrophicus TaxID=2975484 RepID=A0A9X3B5R8_9HYPH|nr:hypothetical protein [Chelativorans petroleitrophicus]MCT8989543.1 hypothetical protein [Chelativorans petroleitrophicus]